MRKLLLVFLMCAGFAGAQDFLARPAYAPGKTLWGASLATLATANALDLHSSWGKHELNPALSNPSGTFGGKGALIKLGLQGGLMGIEYLLTRHRPSPKLYRALAVI